MLRIGSVVLGALLVGACSRDVPTPPHDVPATVDHPQTEAGLTTVRLTQQAAARLGIETATAGEATAAATRTLGGEIVVPEGRSIVVTAPVAGTLTGSAGPAPGTRVARGERLLTIAPLVAVERDQQIEAQRAVAAAEADELMTRQRRQRVEQLLAEGAASVRGLEEARAQHASADAALTAARQRLAAASQTSQGQAGALVVPAPYAGIVQTLSAVPGQTVAAAAPLIQIAQVDALWVRVPVYAGDLAGIDSDAAVLVHSLGADGPSRRASPVAAPLRADATTASVDLFYALPGGDRVRRPGERVLVEVPLVGTSAALVVPAAAILFDIHGSTWVYEDLGDFVYRRRRVEVQRHVGEAVVLGRGATAGMRVVAAGAAELFGTEFGAGH